MNDRKKILLGSEDIVTKSNVDIFIGVNLNQSHRSILSGKYENNFNLLKQFNKERNSCRNFRVYGTVSSSQMNCDNLILNVYNSDSLSPLNLVTQILTKPIISNYWESKNVYGFKEGKYYLELDNYNYEKVYFLFTSSTVSNVFERILIYTSTTYNIYGEKIIQTIDYGTTGVDFDVDGNETFVDNDFPFFYNKHWVKNNMNIKFPERVKLNYSVNPNDVYGHIEFSSPAIDEGDSYKIFQQGSIISVSAVTNLNNISFDQWTESVNDTNSIIQIVLDSEKTLVANFRKNYIPQASLSFMGTPTDYEEIPYQSSVVNHYKVYSVLEGSALNLIVSLDFPAITGLESVSIKAEARFAGYPSIDSINEFPATSSLGIFPKIITFNPGEQYKTITIDTSNNYNMPSTADTIFAVIFDISTTNPEEVSISQFNSYYKNWIRLVSNNNEAKLEIDSMNYVQSGNILTFPYHELTSVPLKITLANTPVGNESARVVVFGKGQQFYYTPYLTSFQTWNDGGMGKEITWNAGDPQTKYFDYYILTKYGYGTPDLMEQLSFQISTTTNLNVSSFNLFNQQWVKILEANQQNVVSVNISGSQIPAYYSNNMKYHQVSMGDQISLSFTLADNPQGSEKLLVKFTPSDDTTTYSYSIIPNNPVTVEWNVGDPKTKTITFDVPYQYSYNNGGTIYTTGEIRKIVVSVESLEEMVLDNSLITNVLIPINNAQNSTNPEITFTLDTANVDYQQDSITWNMNMGESNQMYISLTNPSLNPVSLIIDKANLDDQTYYTYVDTPMPIIMSLSPGQTMTTTEFKTIESTMTSQTPLNLELTVVVTGGTFSNYNLYKQHFIEINREL